MRICALSDIHVDYHQNRSWVEALSSADYTKDVLLLAGDVCHKSDRLWSTLELLRSKFSRVFFLPGNHDLWLGTADAGDSLDKYRQILSVCSSLDIETRPARLSPGAPESTGVWIVPLHAWYLKPEEAAGSLFVPKKGEDPHVKMWVDNRAVKWPSFPGGLAAAAFLLALNAPSLSRQYDAPVISFSHVLPRRELMFPSAKEIRKFPPRLTDPLPRFNFSRVAGCTALDDQIRRLGSRVHVYGHQHRNRERFINGVRYVSHCLGYPRERAEGRVVGVDGGPKAIWEL